MENNMADKEQSDIISSTSHASNPLTRKLNKILETRLDNDKVFLLFSYCGICFY